MKLHELEISEQRTGTRGDDDAVPRRAGSAARPRVDARVAPGGKHHRIGVLATRASGGIADPCTANDPRVDDETGDRDPRAHLDLMASGLDRSLQIRVDRCAGAILPCVHNARHPVSPLEPHRRCPVAPTVDAESARDEPLHRGGTRCGEHRGSLGFDEPGARTHGIGGVQRRMVPLAECGGNASLGETRVPPARVKRITGNNEGDVRPRVGCGERGREPGDAASDDQRVRRHGRAASIRSSAMRECSATAASTEIWFGVSPARSDSSVQAR